MRTRVALLQNELEEKTRLIEKTQHERKELDSTMQKRKKEEFEKLAIDDPERKLDDKLTDLSSMNDKYKVVMSDKVEAYRRCMEGLQSLVEKKCQLTKNQVEICKIER